MTHDHRKKIHIGYLAALLALPVLIIAASISASHTQQEIAAMDHPAAIYGVIQPAASAQAGK